MPPKGNKRKRKGNTKVLKSPREADQGSRTSEPLEDANQDSESSSEELLREALRPRSRIRVPTQKQAQLDEEKRLSIERHFEDARTKYKKLRKMAKELDKYDPDGPMTSSDEELESEEEDPTVVAQKKHRSALTIAFFALCLPRARTLSLPPERTVPQQATQTLCLPRVATLLPSYAVALADALPCSRVDTPLRVNAPLRIKALADALLPS
ncbi:hypothetical protein PYCCODRAFT_1466761 [Trametes coccinea BRFM310]|uniref:Uncharacterized protein n=1 Tax=Trametes coccinea (strain BRFM310) TaxID=1353009 RepID=A0A1Y2IV94_TRAC3|nr:hypothetical protein PYCCODRAFT_1466761 [Trametes coccinea BRFM310]